MTIKALLNKLNRRDTRILPKKFKTFLVYSLIICSFFFFKKALAQTTLPPDNTQIFSTEFTNNNIVKQKQDAIKKGNNQESWMFESMGSNAVSGIDAITGEIPDDVLQGKPGVSWIPGGMIGGTNQMIASLYKQPISGIQYMAQVKDNFLGKPAYAQGVGFQGLQPILPIWKIFRNLVYVTASLIFIIMGLMIMLRVKISAQAVITIQSAIPQLITTLILVTFSYAIVGLLIDLTYFVQSFFVALLFQGSGVGVNQDLFWHNTSTFGKITDVIKKLFFNPASLVDNLIWPNNLSNLSTMGLFKANNLIHDMVPTGTVFALSTIIGLIIGVFFGPAGMVLGAGIGALGGAILLLIIQIIVFVLLIKFLIGLVKCYFTLILKIILGPLEIGLGAIPNMKMGFSSWIMSIIANLAVFPISSLFIIIVTLIMATLNDPTKVLWAPSLISIAGWSGFTRMLIGLGAILILPKLPAMIPEFVFQIKPSPWGKALGEAAKNLPFSGGVKEGYSMARKAGLQAAGNAILSRTGFRSSPRAGAGPSSGGTGGGGPTPPPASP